MWPWVWTRSCLCHRSVGTIWRYMQHIESEKSAWANNPSDATLFCCRAPTCWNTLSTSINTSKWEHLCISLQPRASTSPAWMAWMEFAPAPAVIYSPSPRRSSTPRNTPNCKRFLLPSEPDDRGLRGKSLDAYSVLSATLYMEDFLPRPSKRDPHPHPPPCHILEPANIRGNLSHTSQSDQSMINSVTLTADSR